MNHALGTEQLAETIRATRSVLDLWPGSIYAMRPDNRVATGDLSPRLRVLLTAAELVARAEQERNELLLDGDYDAVARRLLDVDRRRHEAEAALEEARGLMAEVLECERHAGVGIPTDLYNEAQEFAGLNAPADALRNS